ncbi:MAG: hypothetical protein E3J72_21180 [Planctomycetota bacterium]|nr:MAG: hypothetical protein E3J72_21180 [Planctomycetota bacterium]
MSPENGEMSKEDKIAARKAKQEEIIAKVAAKKKRTRKLVILGVVLVAVIITVAVVLSFVLIDVHGGKADWKVGDAFTFKESWQKIIPPQKADGRATPCIEGTRTIIGTCRVLEVANGLPTKLEIEISSYRLRSEEAPTPGKITASRKDEKSPWTYEPELLGNYPLRADFLITCGVDIAAKKWSNLNIISMPPPRWVTPKFPIKCIPDKIKYVCAKDDKVFGFDTYTSTGRDKEKIKDLPKVKIDGKEYPVGVRVKGKFRFDRKHNFIRYFELMTDPNVIGFEYPKREERDIPPPGFYSCRVEAEREWKSGEKKKEPESEKQNEKEINK